MFGAKKQKAAILLSLIVPLSLLFTFRFTGILQGPINPETYTVEAVMWNMNRPDKLTPLDKTLINRYNDDVLSTTFKVYAGHYEENYVWGEGPCNSDSILFGFEATANITTGFIHSFVIRFSQVDTSAAFDVYEDNDHIFLHNVTLGAISQAWTEDNGYIEAYAVNNRDCCNLTMFGQWIFYDDNNTNHNIMFTLETLYYNGTAYRKAEMPMQIWVQIP
jgi:hypothetical protein